MWVKCNINPAKKDVGDCVIRAVGISTDQSWLDVYDAVCLTGREEFDMPSSDAVWGLYLYRQGFEPFILPRRCPQCVTVRAFCQLYPKGAYIIGTGQHAVAILDGDYYDSWDSGNQISSFFWRIK